MLFIDNRDITDARVNLALEEHVLRNRMGSDDYLLFYINAPSIIIGRNQNTIEEVSPSVVAARGITVVRRISGGGAVYHDLGNLNFSFMTPSVHGRFNRYELFTQPVIEVLHDLGVPAELGGRNDILAGGRKISGNAQFARPDRMFSHGTLLFDSNLDDVTAALVPKPGKVESKGVKSIRSRVANISEFLRSPITVTELRELIIERIFGTRDRSRVPTLELDASDWAEVDALVTRKYGSWDWNYGENPPSNVQRGHRFTAGEIDVRVNVESGRVAAVRIFGDFMGREDVAELEALMIGVRYDYASIAAALSDVDLDSYFGDIPPDEALALLAG
jgi:lipoate---protein ligase